MNRCVLLGFPEEIAATFRVDLGGCFPKAQVEEVLNIDISDLMPDIDTLYFLWESFEAKGQAILLFEKQPEMNLVVVSERGDADSGAEFMHLGAMDYRIWPFPSGILAIYERNAGHRMQLSQQAEEFQQNSDPLVSNNVQMRRLLNQISLVAPSNAAIFVTGESGTGKEKISRFIHQCSSRKTAPFVAVNCSAIPESMMESEFFGHEKGAFTGADKARPGKFELASGGTLLLDEITEMPLHLQAKLLRVLQEGEVDRLGGTQPIKVDTRVIATSNRLMSEALAEGIFRQDLYYRLNVVNIQLPSLRQRPEDIVPLAEHFLRQYAKMYGKSAPVLSPEACVMLTTYTWPGNIRELENTMHRASLMAVTTGRVECEMLMLEGRLETHGKHLTTTVPAESSAGGSVVMAHAQRVPTEMVVQHSSGGEIAAGMSVRDVERALIEKTLAHVQGNRVEAAELLGISVRTLRNKLNSYREEV
ncbi:MAG: sigma-54-dependent Fis family transcriptional regulator [Zetaproteobacteria bacterium]|nr:sigma-54-dependent Fis family transcriptional regulator [Zetaproteobacteria bacterium]